MNKYKNKIEKILASANMQFVNLDLPKNETKDKLLQQMNQPVTNLPISRLNITREFIKLKIYRFASSGAIVLVIMMILGGTTVYAANQSLPGNILYPVNKKIEIWHIALIQNPVQKQKVRIIYLQKRAHEWEQTNNKNNTASVLTDNEKTAFKSMNETFINMVNELQAQKMLYLNGLMANNTEKVQFEENLQNMNQIMEQHLKFLKSRENEMEEALASAQNDRQELENFGNAMNEEMSEHLQLMKAMHYSQ